MPRTWEHRRGARSKHERHMRRYAANRQAQRVRRDKTAEAETLTSGLIFLGVIAAMTIGLCLIFKGIP